MMNAYAERQKTLIKSDLQFLRSCKPVGDPGEWQEGGEDELAVDQFAQDIPDTNPIQIQDADDVAVEEGTEINVMNAPDIATESPVKLTVPLTPAPVDSGVSPVTHGVDLLPYEVDPLPYDIGHKITGVDLDNDDVNDPFNDNNFNDEHDVEAVQDSVPAPPVPPQPPPGDIKVAPPGDSDLVYPEITHRYNTRRRQADGVRSGAWNNKSEYEFTDLRPKRRTRQHQINTCKHYYVYRLTVLKAISKLGRAPAVESVVKELKQHLTKGTWHPVAPGEASGHQIIRSHMFLKEKFLADGTFDKLKARLVAGGDMQDRNLYDDVSSPTASITSLLMVAAIAAREKRHVYTLDIGGAYLNA
jgi:hypothetical protein